MSTTEKPAEIVYQPGAVVAIRIPHEPILGTRLVDEDGAICRNVGLSEGSRSNACWVWENDSGAPLYPRLTWREILDEANGPFTVLPPVFKTGDIIADSHELYLLPKGAIVLDSAKEACKKASETTAWLSTAWLSTGSSLKGDSWLVKLPATILWLPEDEEQS